MTHAPRPLAAGCIVAVASLGSAACATEDPTAVVVDNDYPVVLDGGDPATERTVYKGWWVTSLLPDPVAPGGEGAPQRTVPNTDYAYAVLAPGWDPSSAPPPTAFVAARSSVKLTANRGDTLHLHVSPDTFDGDCAAGRPLSQEDADFVTQRIFPAEFGGGAYDARRCVVLPAAADAGPGADGP